MAFVLGLFDGHGCWGGRGDGQSEKEAGEHDGCGWAAGPKKPYPDGYGTVRER
jgi:hypothetical protein